MGENNELTPENFFSCWKEMFKKNKQEWAACWDNNREYTKYILGDANDGIIHQIAEQFRKKAYTEYYKLDAVFYDENDDFLNLSYGPRTEYCFKRLQLAFEHENDPCTIYKELAHLFTINAPLKVLVTYSCKPNPEDMKDYIEEQAGNAQDIDQQILVIVGFKDDNKEINWNGYTLQNGKAKKL